MGLLKSLSLTISVSTQVCYNSPMVDTIWVDSSHGLSLHEGPHPSRDNENGVLFYLEYILLKEAQGQDITEDVAEFKRIIENIRTYAADGSRIPGLYDRGAKESLREDKTTIRHISHDNLTAIAAFDARYGDGEEATKIALIGLKYQLRYDNTYPESPSWKRIQWPSDWAFWALSSSKKVYFMLLIAIWYPLFVVRSIMSMFGKPDSTSGRLLNFVRLASNRDKSLPMKFLWKLFVYTQKKVYGDNWIHEIMKVYFQNPNHPNRNLSDNVKF